MTKKTAAFWMIYTQFCYLFGTIIGTYFGFFGWRP